MKTLGVVAIGRNEGERLRRCLTSIPAGIPVVYVDSASTDGSAALAAASGANVIQLDLAEPFTAARARNAGFKRLLDLIPGVKYVQFIDGDCEVEPGWLESSKIFLDNNAEVAAVCGRRRERHRERSFYNRLCDDEWNTPLGETTACGGDALMRVSAVTAVGGYDSALIAGEEPEMCSRMRQRGWRIWRLDAPMTIHDADMHLFRQWWQRAVRSGFGYAQIWHKTVHEADAALYGRELARAVLWVIGVPLGGVAAALLFSPLALCLIPLVWTVQFTRLAARHGPLKGIHLLLAKPAECIGAIRYAIAVAARRQKNAIYYK